MVRAQAAAADGTESRYLRSHISRRNDAMHTRQGHCWGDIDRANAAMRKGAAQDSRVQQPVTRQIVEIDPLAAQKAQILDALDRLHRYSGWRSSSTPPIGRAGLQHGLDDRDIAGAAAEIAGQHLADAVFVAIRLSLSSACAVVSIPGVQKPHCSA